MSTRQVIIGVGILLGAWGLSCGGSTYLLFVWTLITNYAPLSVPVLDIPWWEIIFALSGTLLMAGLLAGGHGTLMRSHLPTPARRSWMVATMLGGALAWLITMGLYSAFTAEVRRLLDLLRNLDLLSEAGVQILRQLCGFGITAGASGGLALGLLQWVVLHRYVRWAGWWVLVSVIGNTILIILYVALLWLAHGEDFH